MKIPWIPILFASGSKFANALAVPKPVNEASFEISELMTEMFEEQFLPPDTNNFNSLFSKRDTTSTIRNLLDILNSSDLLFDVLDQIAYNPSRISKLANYTASKLGGIDIGSFSNITSGLDIKLDINASAIYNEVMNSGVVTSLLDGILLDSNYRPVLAGIISRLLEGNMNLVNYLIKNVFRSSKRDQIISKRDNSGTLETFVGNVISTVLSSQLVGDLASDVLVALNETQFLTTTVKRLIADEGYQNMTAQFVLDMLQTGSITLNSEAINITSIADKVLSKPQVLVTLVSNLLSGRVSLPALGKYNSAVSAILKEVENDGTFADLNRYVFSETHSVTTPLLPTNQIVVPRTTSAPITTTTRAASNRTTTRRTAMPSSTEISLIFTRSSVSKLSFSFASTTRTTANIRSSRTTTRVISSESGSDQSAAEVASLISVLQGMDSSSNDDTSTATDTDITETSNDYDSSETEIQATTSMDTGGLLSMIQNLGDSSSAELAKKAIEASTSSANGCGYTRPNNIVTRVLVFTQAVIFGGIMFL